MGTVSNTELDEMRKCYTYALERGYTRAAGHVLDYIEKKYGTFTAHETIKHHTPS